MKALFRIPLGHGRFLAVFTNAIILEYYEKKNMVGCKRVI